MKGDDPCANFADCVICSTFSEDQKKKIRNRNRCKSKKDQTSSVSVDNGGKEGSIDDSLLDEDEVSFSLSSQGFSMNLLYYLKEFRIWSKRTLKLPAVMSALAGTVYRLLSNRW